MESLASDSRVNQQLARDQYQSELPAWLYLGLPLVLVSGFVIARLVSLEFFNRWIYAKEGALERATVIILIPAVYAGIRAFKQRRRLPARWLGGWLLLMTLGSVYFACEEVSWGQHLFKWQAPEAIRAINKQDETNLHNIGSLFNEKPRGLLELFVFIGGIVMAYRLGRHRSARSWKTWFWPGWVCIPVAVITVGVRIPDRLEKYFGIGSDDPALGAIFNMHVSEAQEFFFAMFLMVYLTSFRLRLERLPESSSNSAVTTAGILGPRAGE